MGCREEAAAYASEALSRIPYLYYERLYFKCIEDEEFYYEHPEECDEAIYYVEAPFCDDDDDSGHEDENDSGGDEETGSDLEKPARR